MLVGGDARGKVSISAPPLGVENYQLKLSAELKALNKPSLGLAGLKGMADVVVMREKTTLLLHAMADDLALEVEAILRLKEPSWCLEFQRLEASYYDAFEVSLWGEVEKERIDLTGKLMPFELNKLPFVGVSNFTGQASGTLFVSGSLDKPKVDAAVDVVDFTTVAEGFDELPILNFHLDAKILDGFLQGKTCITNAVAGRMNAVLEMPCEFSVEPFRFKMKPQCSVASFEAQLDLKVLNGLSGLQGQRVQGQLDSSFIFDGQKDVPLSGHVAVMDGSYEHYHWGVMVQDVQVEMEVEQEYFVVREMTATDGEEGRIAVSGSVGLLKSGIPLDVEVNFEKANLIHRDEVEATLSGGIQIGETLSTPSISGKLVIDRADILLDHIAPPEPRLLTNFDADEPAKEPSVISPRAELPFALDLEVSMPDQIFIEASAIHSVWGGELKIKSMPEGVSVRGMVESKRGYLSFIGKKFRFTDGGRIDFDGAVPASPSLNIRAEYSRSDVVAHLALSGKANNPHYTLTSTPSMPEDEVLSQVLFGRNTSEISPYQAYQIAAAAQQLSGGVRGPGFMYQVRQALSIDSLEWRESDTPEGRSSVAAGKYLTSSLYVEVNSTFEDKEGSTGMSAEYEITKHFSVETSTGSEMRPGIGVTWKNDY